MAAPSLPNPFQKATKSQLKLRMGIMGPSNSGKTWMALTTACALGRVAVIDSESRSASKYANLFNFDALNLTDKHPDRYVDAIEAAERAGYDVVVIDSLTHAWDATKDAVDAEVLRSKSGNSFQIWGKVGQVYNRLMARIVASKIHVIATMRSKTEYLIEKDERGKSVPRKIGTAPQVRDGAEYEFDVVMELDHEHNAWTVKTRCPALDGKTWQRPGVEIATTLRAWLNDGAAVVEVAPTLQQEAPAPSPKDQAPAATTASKPATLATATTPPATGDTKAECKALYQKLKVAIGETWALKVWENTFNAPESSTVAEKEAAWLFRLETLRDLVDAVVRMRARVGDKQTDAMIDSSFGQVELNRESVQAIRHFLAHASSGEQAEPDLQQAAAGGSPRAGAPHDEEPPF